jgi:hypothetical protein
MLAGNDGEITLLQSQYGKVPAALRKLLLGID